VTIVNNSVEHHQLKESTMARKLASLHPNIVRILVAVGTLTMFVLSAGAPRGYGS
jgi:hypothetical protein